MERNFNKLDELRTLLTVDDTEEFLDHRIGKDNYSLKLSHPATLTIISYRKINRNWLHKEIDGRLPIGTAVKILITKKISKRYEYITKRL